MSEDFKTTLVRFAESAAIMALTSGVVSQLLQGQFSLVRTTLAAAVSGAVTATWGARKRSQARKGA